MYTRHRQGFIRCMLYTSKINLLCTVFTSYRIFPTTFWAQHSLVNWRDVNRKACVSALNCRDTNFFCLFVKLCKSNSLCKNKSLADVLGVWMRLFSCLLTAWLDWKLWTMTSSIIYTVFIRFRLLALLVYGFLIASLFGLLNKMILLLLRVNHSILTK